MRELQTRAEQYLRRAAEFAEKAEAAADPQMQMTYRNFAESYRRLSRRVLALTCATDAEIEEFARRVVRK